jgi:hypothetical protein
MSATPMTKTNAVITYQKVLVRVRCADRTAARRRFARDA